jgi:hypothetical protein
VAGSTLVYAPSFTAYENELVWVGRDGRPAGTLEGSHLWLIDLNSDGA